MAGGPPEDIAREIDAARLLNDVTGNPTLSIILYYTQATQYSEIDPPVALHLIELMRAMATSVRNQFFRANSSQGLAVVLATAGKSEDALAAGLDAADELQRTGWHFYAWSTAWSCIEPLYRLGRIDEAAVLLGGCETSGVGRLPQQLLPDELDALSSDNGDPRLRQLRSVGRQLPLADLLRTAAGLNDLPASVSERPLRGT